MLQAAGNHNSLDRLSCLRDLSVEPLDQHAAPPLIYRNVSWVTAVDFASYARENVYPIAGEVPPQPPSTNPHVSLALFVSMVRHTRLAQITHSPSCGHQIAPNVSIYGHAAGVHCREPPRTGSGKRSIPHR